MKEFKIRKDKHREIRGGWSRVWEIYCTKCDFKHLIYQEDGPGILKRLYQDRILKLYSEMPDQCGKCKKTIAFEFIYTNHGESRIAYRLFVGAIKKHKLFKE